MVDLPACSMHSVTRGRSSSVNPQFDKSLTLAEAWLEVTGSQNTHEKCVVGCGAIEPPWHPSTTSSLKRRPAFYFESPLFSAITIFQWFGDAALMNAIFGEYLASCHCATRIFLEFMGRREVLSVVVVAKFPPPIFMRDKISRMRTIIVVEQNFGIFTCKICHK